MSAAARTIHGFWGWLAGPSARRFESAMMDPEQAQRERLRRILKYHAQTEFGRAHGFSNIRRAEDYQTAVPVSDELDYQPWLEAAASGKPDVLTPGKPLALLPTSGTHGAAKLIPWTRGLKREFDAALGPWIHGFMREHPRAWQGSVYWSLSPPVWPCKQNATGIRIGFDTDASYLPAAVRPLLGAVFAVPSSVPGLRDPLQWRYATLLHLLAAADLSMISVWSPTFLTALLEPLAGCWDDLLRDLETGRFSAINGFSPPRNGRRRAAELRGLAEGGALPDLRRIWPRLAAISCWTDAAAREPARQLAACFGGAPIVRKGLVATEGVVSIPWPGAEAPALAINSHFYEFIDLAGKVHPSWDLRAGETYSVLLTTGGGLYRYRLGDRIRVLGYQHRCPLLEFTGREGVGSDLCGEKLAEPVVRDCLNRVAHQFGEIWAFAILAPTSGGGILSYTLFFTGRADPAAVARAIDEVLCENPHYAHARRIGQLGAARAFAVSGGAGHAWAEFQRVRAGRGQRLGDIKPSALDPQPGWELVFAGSEKPSTLRPA